jgi:hypothetical protein
MDLPDIPKLLTYTVFISDDSALSASFGGAKLQSIKIGYNRPPDGGLLF